MDMVSETATADNVTPEVAGRRLFEAGQYWIEGDTGHVEDDGYVFAVPIRETGPVCYCTEFAQWGTCAHAECILNATGEAEPVNMD